MRRTPDLRIAAATLALIVAVPLAAFLVLAYPEYRDELVVARETPSHEAIDGLFIGVAVMRTFNYELIVATVVIQVFAAVALFRRWRLLLPVASLALFLCAVPLYLVGKHA